MKKEKQIENNAIDEIIVRYQEGDEAAGEEILRMYGGHPNQNGMSHYLGKYFKMLRYGKLDFKDKDSRLFMNLFIEDASIREQLRQSYQYKLTKEIALRKLGGIVQSLQHISDEDLEQDLRFLFLKKVIKYKKMNRNFKAYIANTYRYAVENYIQKITNKRDLSNHPRKLIRLADDRLHDGESDIHISDSIFEEGLMMHTEEDLDNNWVRGLTCGEEFKELTPLQRLIIKLNYYDGYSDGKIADTMGIHINTIFRQRKKADLQVKATVERLIEEGFYS